MVEVLTVVEDISCVIVTVILWVYELTLDTPRENPINPFIRTRTRYYLHTYPTTHNILISELARIGLINRLDQIIEMIN
jgi:hypothetical protein